jgi:hypothetical protein
MKKFFSVENDSPLSPIFLAIALLTLNAGVGVFAFFYNAHPSPGSASLHEPSSIIAFCGQMLLFVAMALLLMLVARWARYARRQHNQLVAQVANSHRTYLFSENDDADVGSDQAAVEKLTNSLKQAVSFTRKVAQGESEIEWLGMNDNNRSANQTTLAGELIRMREQMVQVREDDQKRLWSTEGLSRVAEITRQHQSDVQRLSDQLLTYLVRYLRANQGMLFFWEEEKQHLVLASCHAYDKKKFIEQQIKPGEGLVGQTFLEQETTHLTEIPPSYMDITSGLGKASPSSLLLVPLKVNEQTIGILELASFGTFAEHTITFLKEAGEIIASSVATAQLNRQTQLLLTQSQQQAEEMRAQEEEMRQNVEELQATQEEMERKAQELFHAKEELEKKNEEAQAIRVEEQKRAEEQIEARNKMLIEAKKRFDQRERELLDQLKAKN